MMKRWMVAGLAVLSLTLLAGEASARDGHGDRHGYHDRGHHAKSYSVRDHGRWHHGRHHGRDGLWWIVGNVWTYYGARPAPIVYGHPVTYPTVTYHQGPVVRYVYAPY